MTLTVYTIGHSNRTLEELLYLLQAHGVQRLADVRSFPGSRRNPHFNAENLAVSLPAAGIEYLPFKALGGRRKLEKDATTNLAWRHPAFRAYADYMQTPAFEAALAELMRLAAETPTAIMCSEALPWQCHRSLVGDALVARGVTVLDIMNAGSARPHELPSWARVDDQGRVAYPLPLDVSPG